MSEEVVNVDIAKEIQRSESIWKLFHGHIGIGKTLYMTGEVLLALQEYGVKLVITNYDLYGLPEGIEIFKSGSVRKIMERMIKNYDVATKMNKVPVLVVIDEINNTLSSKQAASNISTWITTIASNARKYGVRAFYFSTQGRKQSDYRLRVNCSYEVAPTGKSDVDGRPLAYWWDDAEKWETDIHRGEDNYEDAVLIPSVFTVQELQGRYNTTELVPIDLNPSVKEEELDEVMQVFLEWCGKKSITLQEFKRTDVKDFIRRWNNDRNVNVIPYSPAGEQVIFSELVRLGYVEPKAEEPVVAEEPEEPEVSQVNEVKNSSLPTLPNKQELIDELIKDPLIEKAFVAELLSPGSGTDIVNEASEKERQSAILHISTTTEKVSESRRLVKCDHCGHEQMTRMKVPVCSKCHRNVKSANGGQPNAVEQNDRQPTA